MVQKTLKAFTLIELLIVVAIIAILAAIAVPNFLEAQTRSKVSRVKSDMRTLATGIESYYVDNNRYMLGFSSTYGPEVRWGLQSLSTPISYVTNPYIVDVFIPQQAQNIQTGSGGSFSVTDPRDLGFQYSLRNAGGGGTSGLAASIAQFGAGSWWLLRSFGPDKDADSYSTNILNNDVPSTIDDVYDPTNGTVSNGNIYRVGGSGINEAGRALSN